MEALEIKNAAKLIKLNPWLLENNCEELKLLVGDAKDYKYFNPAGIAPSYSNHIADGNECLVSHLKTFINEVPA